MVNIPEDPGPLVTWRGKYLEDMTREELIAALRQAAGLYVNVLRERRPISPTAGRPAWRDTTISRA